ncbi:MULTISPECIES: nucleotidyltransferase family protein [unclassified Marinimicrobium]|jgi:molybdenum cofactor cytidylyltransferase|uniref:nucleotidyltransferase family protein n=1 Tax=unclassified Marinimicrobium TaxID=2632100 RepID=UPI000C6AD3B7|nr:MULTISPECIES: nucleotidyltransferase family protein [unclassified Marinimicrobium]MAN50533.1 CTP--molybdopterin cytidylyltransferase [Marinimicrobium sp.]
MPSSVTPSSNVVGLIMAAGYSTRFGADKRRAQLTEGQTLLQATVAMTRSVFEAFYVVLRSDDEERDLGLGTEPVIYAPEEPIGLGTSIAAAFHHLRVNNKDATAAAVLLGDMPWIKPDAFSELLNHATEDTIIRPVYDGNAGHPVLFGRHFWPELANLHGDLGARTIIRKHHSCCHLVPVSDVGVLRDVDRPSDLGKA